MFFDIVGLGIVAKEIVVSQPMVAITNNNVHLASSTSNKVRLIFGLDVLTPRLWNRITCRPEMTEAVPVR